MAPHPENLEQEASLFAATLLMPADDFRKHANGQPPTLATISRLADKRYNTSLTATCTRLLDLSPTAHYGMTIVRGNTIVRWKTSKEMRWTGFGFRKGHQISADALVHDPDGQRVESDLWLNAKNAPRWELTQSAIYMPYYDQTLGSSEKLVNLRDSFMLPAFLVLRDLLPRVFIGCSVWNPLFCKFQTNLSR